MGKKRERIFKPKKVIYRYVTFTDDNGVLQQAFEEVPQHGITQNRVIPLGVVPKDDDEDCQAEQNSQDEAVDFECSQSMDEDERIFMQSLLKEKQPEKPDAVTHNYEVELSSIEVSIKMEFSENSYLSNDENFVVDLTRPVATDNEFVSDLPKSQNKIISADKKSKQFLLNQLFGNINYEDADLEDAEEILQQKETQQVQQLDQAEQLEMEENIQFFKQDFEQASDSCGNIEQAQELINEDLDSEFLEDIYEDEKPQLQQADLNIPVALKTDIDDYIQKYNDNDDNWKEYYNQLSQPKQQIITLEDRTKTAKILSNKYVQSQQMIVVSKKTGAIIEHKEASEQSTDSNKNNIELVTVVLPHYRGKKENQDERKARKQEIKDAKLLRRKNNELVKELIEGEKQRLKTAHVRNNGNIQGRAIQ
ncbi:hypothetical protein SS50377_20253 [Spironucleus salmonicida]|uniref:Uncharacterized protein n=1 Tax=Spironucleus salmonicida TaxID=348837 RepID=V6LL80_9EUKA|nr:hypothetical protein SS50377_20253 [Spironucleus salmonicida]|eukprot:EST45307.1 Hypothetical protein SS50377_14884 [Spironucleus salmonicida]